MRIIVLLLVVILSATTLSAQVNESSASSDVIIRVDGSILYGKVLQVDQEHVIYRKNDMVDGPAISLPRNQVYAISYSNSTTQVITPAFGKKKIDEMTFDQNTMGYTKENKDTTANLKYNLAHGSLKVGLGFAREYSSFKGVDDFSKSASAPSIYAAYEFRFNRFLITGVNIGYASFNYKYEQSSDYDQIDISQSIRETIGTLGFYGRYNLLDGFVKPYLQLGLNINYSDATLEGDIFFREEAKHIITHSGVRGFKTNFVLRAGVDFDISKQFGLYTDIGTGTSLIQIGAIFIFK